MAEVRLTFEDGSSLVAHDLSDADIDEAADALWSLFGNAFVDERNPDDVR